jgi:hypothetical protein
MASPFNLALGDSVYASVICINGVGNSPQSSVGNGAVITVSVVPDAPQNLVRDPNIVVN